MAAAENDSASKTSTGSTDSVSESSLAEERYGRRPKKKISRWHRWGLAVLAVGLGALIAFVAYHNLGSAPIESERLGFSEISPNSMEIVVDVRRDQPDQAAVCIVRVRDITGAESGRREVLVPAGTDHNIVTATITSSAKPVTAEVVGCSYKVPRYLSSLYRPTE